MNKNETMREVKKQIKRWSYIVTHYGWAFTFYYHDSQEDMPEVASDGCAAYTTADFNYLDASIHINLRACQNLDADTIEYIVIHELTHLLISPMKETTGELEYVVTSIARVFQGLRNG